MSNCYLPIISRRTTLQWLAAVVGSAFLPRQAQAERLAIFKPTPKGYGSDPNLNQPAAPWERTMTDHQLQLTAVLADLLLPATSSAPAPSALGIPDFVNEWVSAPYPEQLHDRPIILEGLDSLDKTAMRRWGKAFLAISDSQKQAMLDRLIAQWRKASPSTASDAFFYRFRSIVVGAYYTTPKTYKDLGYLGNVPMESYPPATEEELAILERQFKKLGLAASK
jgi:hypothetical protein